MSSKAALRVAEQTGCLPAEAAATLEVEPDVERATKALRAVLNGRRALYRSRLTAVWAEYAGSETAEEMGLDETIAYIQALGLALEDPLVLAVVYELQAPRIGALTFRGFLDGWARLEASNLEDMRERAVPELKHRLESDADYFRCVYRFTFRFNLDDGSRTLALDTAVAYWQLLLVPRYEIAAKWVEFAQLPTQSGSFTHGVSADTWNMVLELCEFVTRTDPHLTQYDETSAWPMVIDDFVEWFRAGAKNEGSS